MAVRCISPLFVKSSIYFLYSKDWGGGGYVVKTYPPIDPIVAPPPLPDINYILCVTFITASVT